MNRKYSKFSRIKKPKINKIRYQIVPAVQLLYSLSSLSSSRMSSEQFASSSKSVESWLFSHFLHSQRFVDLSPTETQQDSLALVILQLDHLHLQRTSSNALFGAGASSIQSIVSSSPSIFQAFPTGDSKPWYWTRLFLNTLAWKFLLKICFWASLSLMTWYFLFWSLFKHHIPYFIDWTISLCPYSIYVYFSNPVNNSSGTE